MIEFTPEDAALLIGVKEIELAQNRARLEQASELVKRQQARIVELEQALQDRKTTQEKD